MIFFLFLIKNENINHVPQNKSTYSFCVEYKNRVTWLIQYSVFGILTPRYCVLLVSFHCFVLSSLLFQFNLLFVFFLLVSSVEILCSHVAAAKETGIGQ